MEKRKDRKDIMKYLGVLCCLLLSIAFAGKAFALEDYKKYYLEGLEYKEKGRCDLAIASFSKALEDSAKEKKRIRFYGMRYGEYFPHREKGICHYELKQYREAIVELETSINLSPSEDAQKYLAMAQVDLAKVGDESLFRVVKTPEELKKVKEAREINKHAVAVIIGNRDYKDRDIPPVNYAINDAMLMRESLIKTFGYRDGNIIFETNASKGDFENIFGNAETHKGKLFNFITPEKSDVFVFYSGHGAPSLETKKGYILPVDGNPNSVGIGGYPLDLLYSNLAKLNARSVTVITDACFSGATLFKKASPVGIIVKNPLVAKENTSIINSSAGTELSSWFPEKGHGLFTYYFLLGLTGEADADRDRKITYGELSAYLSDNVPYMARRLHGGRKQTPSVKTANFERVLVEYK